MRAGRKHGNSSTRQHARVQQSHHGVTPQTGTGCDGRTRHTVLHRDRLVDDEERYLPPRFQSQSMAGRTPGEVTHAVGDLNEFDRSCLAANMNTLARR